MKYIALLMKSPWQRTSRRTSGVTPVIAVLVIGAAAAALFAFRWQAAEGELRRARAWTSSVLDSLARSIEPPGPPVGPEGRDSVYWQWVATSAHMQSRRWQNELRQANERRGTLLSGAELAALRAQGLENPERQLRDSLAAHPELIPYRDKRPPMRFVKDRMVLLRAPYAFAYFENGREAGHMLVAYRLRDGAEIRWSRLWWGLVE